MIWAKLTDCWLLPYIEHIWELYKSFDLTLIKRANKPESKKSLTIALKTQCKNSCIILWQLKCWKANLNGVRQWCSVFESRPVTCRHVLPVVAHIDDHLRDQSTAAHLQKIKLALMCFKATLLIAWKKIVCCLVILVRPVRPVSQTQTQTQQWWHDDLNFNSFWWEYNE